MVHRAYILTEKGTIQAETVRGLLPEGVGEECEPKKLSAAEAKKSSRGGAAAPAKKPSRVAKNARPRA